MKFNLKYLLVGLTFLILFNPLACLAENTFTIRVIDVYAKEEATYFVKDDFDIPFRLLNQKCQLFTKDPLWKPDGSLVCWDQTSAFGVSHRISCAPGSPTTYASVSISAKNIIEHLKKEDKYKKVSKEDKSRLAKVADAKRAIMSYFNIVIDCKTEKNNISK